jgi:hypothetical protein
MNMDMLVRRLRTDALYTIEHNDTDRLAVTLSRYIYCHQGLSTGPEMPLDRAVLPDTVVL